jgi:hypothetical protein
MPHYRSFRIRIALSHSARSRWISCMIECVALIPSAASQGGSECSDPRPRDPKRIEIFCDQCRRRGVGSLHPCCSVQPVMRGEKTDGSKAADLVCARRVWWNIWFEAGTPHHVASHWRGDIVMAGRRVAGFDGDRCDQRSSNDFMLLLAPHGQCRLRSLAARRVAAADIPSRRHI